MTEAQMLADAINNAAPGVPYAGGECVISDLTPGVVVGVGKRSGRSVRVTGLGGSPDSIPVMVWSQAFDDHVTLYGWALVGRRVFVVVADRQPFIVDLAVGG